MFFSERDFDNLKKGVEVASMLNWTDLSQAFRKHHWADVAEISVEDGLTIATPWLPQAGMAKFVLHLAYSMTKSAADGHEQTGKFQVKDLLKGLVAAEGVDWTSYMHALQGDNPIVAGFDTAEILTKLAAPFFPPAAFGGPVFGVLAELGKHTHPANPNSVPGYRWDSLRGWVKE